MSPTSSGLVSGEVIYDSVEYMPRQRVVCVFPFPANKQGKEEVAKKLMERKELKLN